MEELNSKMSELNISEKTSKKIKIKKKINLICSLCKKSFTNKLCLCYKLKYYNENIKSIIKIQKFIREYNSLYIILSLQHIKKNFENEINGYHIINNQPIKEAVWEIINENIIKNYYNVSETSCGNHKSGKDMKIGIHNISNKSCKIDKNKVHISSYRLTKVCNNNNFGDINEIIKEIENRDNSFNFYSLLCREEYESGIKYYWCIIPKTYYIFNVCLQNFKNKYGSGKNKDKVTGWKGEYFDITFSMSSQLWFHFDFTKIKKFVIHETYINYKNTLTYSDIYKLYNNKLS
jgi:hypothetical protein